MAIEVFLKIVVLYFRLDLMEEMELRALSTHLTLRILFYETW